MNSYTEVLFDEYEGKDGNLGIITLNRPEVLNSLNHDMIEAMHKQLIQWATAAHIKAVIIKAVPGRAFCAGGDIRLTYDRCKKHDPAAAEFFQDEYQLNRCIFHFPKPYIALLDGITMGGGVGISIHGSHRVATEKLLFSMPETGIGFFPDVGGTYFLPRLPGNTGIYLGLTGARIHSDDCVALGLTQHKVASEQLSQLIAALAQQSFGANANEAVTQVIQQFQMEL
jgi:enoyl-CoA hydratase